MLWAIEFIYVDKTNMIAYINSVVKTKQKYMCVSRPRRFGKTMAVDMLCAYYGKGESSELFADRKISECENWNKYIKTKYFHFIRFFIKYVKFVADLWHRV